VNPAPGAIVDAAACWLVTLAIHGTLLLAAALLAGALLGRRATGWQELLLRIGLLAPVATSVLQWWLLGGPLELVPAFTAAPDLAAPPALTSSSLALSPDALGPEPASSLPTARDASATSTPGALVVVVALALAALGLAWLLRLRARLRALLAARRPVTDHRVRVLAAQVAAALGRRGAPRLSCCPGLASPVVFGLLRPEVCLPLRAGELGDDELRALLAHELAHVQRADALWLWLGAILHAVFPWQLLLWPARRRLHLLAELRCDAEACKTSTPTAMAECLLAVAAWVRRPAALPALAPGMAARPSALRRRVEAVLGGPRAGRVPLAAALLVSLALLATVTAAAPGVRSARLKLDAGGQTGASPARPPAAAVPRAPVLDAADGLRRERDALLAEVAALRRELGPQPDDLRLQRLLVLLEDQVAALMRASDRLEAALLRLERSGPDASARRTR
jgi:beta-lactamase regulating signal transducer with metallopeptidase domain